MNRTIQEVYMGDVQGEGNLTWSHIGDYCFSPVSATMDGDDDKEQQTLLNISNTIYDLHITDVRWSDIILDCDTKEKIGKRFQNPVYDPTSKRIGTDRGYHFYFSTDANKYTEGKPYYLANQLLYFSMYWTKQLFQPMESSKNILVDFWRRMLFQPTLLFQWSLWCKNMQLLVRELT